MKHLRAIIDSPKTSVPGIVMILGAFGLIAQDWKALLDPQRATVSIGGLVTGAGLLMAAQVKTDGMPTPHDPPRS